MGECKVKKDLKNKTMTTTLLGRLATAVFDLFRFTFLLVPFFKLICPIKNEWTILAIWFTAILVSIFYAKLRIIDEKLSKIIEKDKNV